VSPPTVERDRRAWKDWLSELQSFEIETSAITSRWILISFHVTPWSDMMRNAGRRCEMWLLAAGHRSIIRRSVCCRRYRRAAWRTTSRRGIASASAALSAPRSSPTTSSRRMTTNRTACRASDSCSPRSANVAPNLSPVIVYNSDWINEWMKWTKRRHFVKQPIAGLEHKCTELTVNNTPVHAVR